VVRWSVIQTFPRNSRVERWFGVFSKFSAEETPGAFRYQSLHVPAGTLVHWSGISTFPAEGKEVFFFFETFATPGLLWSSKFRPFHERWIMDSQ